MMDAMHKAVPHDIALDEVFPHAPSVLWKALTTGSLIARWMMEPKGFAPVVGTRFTFQTTPAGAWDGTIRCEVIEVKENERFSYSWKGGDEGNSGYGSLLDTMVSWTLSETKGGTRLQLVHSGFLLSRNVSAYEGLGKGWKVCLERLAGIAAEEDMPAR
ncbi:SRPBCC family protein [Rhizobium halophilum]|uniref:SRPBCC family protein n=1 Tax=Rhizobium halophilum TaxID=2846852 RepID=UPI001EFE1770|nr:SRPBCC domain-containing protein [Rhizobium halophilum]MCF6370808.1 SRPBCC domain-containing protein [Rhizobium halophilum]